MTILLYSNRAEDPVAKTLLLDPTFFDIDQLLNVDELAADMEMTVCPTNGISQISADAAITTKLGGVDRNQLLINRCYFHRDLQFNNPALHRETFTLFSNVLGKFIQSFSQSTAKVGLYGLTGDSFPLYLQWKVVRDAQLGVSTPRYHYAFSSEPPITEGFTKPIYTNPFVVDNWQPNEPPDVNWHTFVVDRPVGMPICAFVLGSEVLAFSPTAPEQTLPTGLVNRITTLAADIVQAHSARIGEVLFFVDGDTICFAAYSSIPSTSAYHPAFAARLANGLKSLAAKATSSISASEEALTDVA